MTKEINVSDTCEFLQHNQSSTADCGHGKTVTVFYPHARHTSKGNPPSPLKENSPPPSKENHPLYLKENLPPPLKENHPLYLKENLLPYVKEKHPPLKLAIS